VRRAPEGCPDIVRLVVVYLLESGITDIRLLDGDLAAWIKSGCVSEASPGMPPDAECIDYLFFVHDRHAKDDRHLHASKHASFQKGCSVYLSRRLGQ
jgi:hypothetical protein